MNGYPRITHKEKYGKGECRICQKSKAGEIIIEKSDYKTDILKEKICSFCLSRLSDRTIMVKLGLLNPMKVQHGN